MRIGSYFDSGRTAEYHAAALECSINEPFVLLRFTLGDRAPTITGVKVYGSDHSIPSEINMEVDFAWNGSQNMELFVRPVPKSMGPATVFAAIISQIILLKVSKLQCTLRSCST